MRLIQCFVTLYLNALTSHEDGVPQFSNYFYYYCVRFTYVFMLITKKVDNISVNKLYFAEMYFSQMDVLLFVG